MTASPCVGICRVDPDRRYCIGCGRTLAEIAAWRTMSPKERLAIMARLEASGATPLPAVN